MATQTYRTVYTEWAITSALTGHTDNPQEHDIPRAVRIVLTSMNDVLPPGWVLDKDGVLSYPFKDRLMLGNVLGLLDHVYGDDPSTLSRYALQEAHSW